MTQPRLKPADTACPRCGSPAPANSPHVQIAGSAIRVFCSALCLSQRTIAPQVEESRRELPTGKLLVAGLFTAVVLTSLGLLLRTEVPLPEVRVTTEEGRPLEVGVAHEGARLSASDRRFVHSIAGDHWVHPLRGPRRMPRVDGRVFGAERPGERPPSCRSGHCGVDIGGTWGEPIFAAGDGEVIRVVRKLNSTHGGRYVRIAHRDATVFTQYFHLAGVPPWIRRGTQVRAGELIGLLGSTGIQRSAPHLHFTISVKPDPEGKETFIDPEPLIALWPVVESAEEAGGPWIASTRPLPGVPRGATGRRKRARSAKPSRRGAGVHAARAVDAEARDATSPALDSVKQAPEATPPLDRGMPQDSKTE